MIQLIHYGDVRLTFKYLSSTTIIIEELINGQWVNTNLGEFVISDPKQYHQAITTAEQYFLKKHNYLPY